MKQETSGVRMKKLTEQEKEAVDEAIYLVEDAKPVPCDVVAILLRMLGYDVEEG